MKQFKMFKIYNYQWNQYNMFKMSDYRWNTSYKNFIFIQCNYPIVEHDEVPSFFSLFTPSS